MKRIVILGGGFGGVYTAMHLEKTLKGALQRKEVELVLINRDNYFTYQPILSEIIGGSVGLLDTVSPLYRLLPKTSLIIREIERIDLEKKEILLSPLYTHTPKACPFDHLIISLGNVTDFRNSPGLHEHALAFKNLGDTLLIRNRIIDAIEAAATETDPVLRKKLLTFVIAGGGFSGTEACAEINDFARKLCKDHTQIDPKELRVILIHSQKRLLEREVDESLGLFASEILTKRGVEILFEKKLIAASPDEAILDDHSRIETCTIVSSVPSNPNPLIQELNIPKLKDKILTNRYLQVEGTSHLWALGDCAAVPLNEHFCPPTAQFATRQAKCLAKNLTAELFGQEKKPFFFKALGMLGALGHHSAVAEFRGGIKFSGLFAWILWRMIYWVKLPGAVRKIKTLISWILEFIVPMDAVQLRTSTSGGITPLHFETGDLIFKEGDVGDYLYIITEGEVEVFNAKGRLATLHQGEYFGEMALLSRSPRSASIRCLKPTNVLAINKKDFGSLITHFHELKANFEATETRRKSGL